MKKNTVFATWWFAVLLAFAFVLLPGPDRSFFSGAPLASRALLPFFLLLLLSVFTALYGPRRPVRVRWLFALVVLVAAKLLLANLLVSSGWRGYYATSADWTRNGTKLRFATFVTDHRLRPYRLDRDIAFSSVTWGLDFMNDAVVTAENLDERRDIYFPLLVRWRGYFAGAPRVQHVSVSAKGRLRISAAGRILADAIDPAGLAVTIPATSGEVAIEYFKPKLVKPAASVTGYDAVVTPYAASEARITRSNHAGQAITVLGLVMLGVLFLAFTDAYSRMSVLFLDEIWVTPIKVAAFVFFAFFVYLAVSETVPNRHSTILEGLGDDPLAYERDARLIVRYGLLMVDPNATPGPYFFYPFYSYALAGAHLLFGEDMANMILFNYLCMASIGLLMWAILRRHVSSGPGVTVIVVTGVFVLTKMVPYCGSAFTDNLYAPLVLAVVVCSIGALERRSMFLLWLTGVLTAIGAATRPSFLLFVPFFAGWLLIDRGVGGWLRRFGASLAFLFGFASGVAPFTIRNWIVSRKLVLIVASFIMLPFFLTPPERAATGIFWNGQLPTAGQAIILALRIIREHPVEVVWVEIRKILFTLGLTGFGPDIPQPRFFFLFTILFGLAIWSRRLPRNVQNAMIVFALSHVAAMVVGSPWSYGYKTILPLHLVFLASAAFLLPNWGEQREFVGFPGAPLSTRRKRTVSVVLPTYNEKESIRGVIEDFFRTGAVDEVLVINNNAVAGTSEEVSGTGAREIMETRQGYGAAIRRGLAEAKCELIVVCEPDGTFVARDIHKLLAYADDFDIVYGSRTSQQFVWHGANMGVFLRWGNWAVAKYVEFLYNATSLTDVGCTMRLIPRAIAHALADQFQIDGSQFGPEMMITTLRAGYRVVQVPVNYRPRVGVSAVTGDPAKAFILGLQMLWLVTSRRFQDLAAPRETASAAPAEPAEVRA